VSSRFLIFVEGVASSPACTDACFWGENLIVLLQTTPHTHTHDRTRAC
jgi:hypothetical protein